MALPPAILITGGKGGVGKSTVAACLSRVLAQQGLKVGLLDADLTGPSQSLLFDLPELSGSCGRLLPPDIDGVTVVSLGSAVSESWPLVWNPLTLRGTLRQMIKETEWGRTEVLVVDTPPGANEVHLAMDEYFFQSASLCVTTGSPLALADCRRSLSFARQRSQRILGLVENMTILSCDHCGCSRRLFSETGLDLLSQDVDVPILARLPWTENLCSTLEMQDLARHCVKWLGE